MKRRTSHSLATPVRRPVNSRRPMQVAAVCYRRTGAATEFLLVNTSAGKWTFPKGRLSPWLSPSEAAAREALEEAGVHGEIQEDCFAHYLDVKRGLGHGTGMTEILIGAYLLEVESLVAAHEPGRNPTWFSAAEARERLAELRPGKYSRELGKIIDAALRVLRRSEKMPIPARQRRSTQLMARW